MKAKNKNKKNVRKLSRLKFTQKEESPSTDDTIDLSNLRKPVPTSLSSLRQVVKLFDNGSDEVRSVLDYECEIIYECRICRSLFRSLANFVSHKRVYCRDKFDVTLHRSTINPQAMSCQANQASLDVESKENNRQLLARSPSPMSPVKKDLTTVIEMLQKRKADDEDNCREKPPMRIVADNEQVLLEMLESNKVAYQTVLEPMQTDIDASDLMKAQAMEVQNILSRNTAVLGPNGQLIEMTQLEKSDSPLQIYDNPEDSLSSNSSTEQSLVCSICEAKFATKKTLTFHMKSLHTPQRTVYPCPCCENLFTSSWGVYRHLFKIHRKSNEQVRKLRNQIQERAYLTESTRAQDLAKDSANSKRNNNNQTTMNETEEWMAHLETDGELQRCGGCGKRFDRKAALLSHSQICQKRIAACVDGAARAKRAKMILETSTMAPIHETSISIKDIIPKVMQKEQPKEEVLRIGSISSAVTITRLSHEPEINIRVEEVSSLSKDDWEKMGGDGDEAAELEKIESEEEEKKPTGDDDPEIIFTKIEKHKNITVSSSKKRRLAKANGQRSSQSLLIKRSKTSSFKERPDSPDPPRPVSNRVKAIERRIATIADLKELRCLPCNKKFSSMANLRRHMAIHINWNRYRCNVCGFKCFEKVDCVAHCNMAHDAKNNRTVIAGMMIEIQPDDSSTAAGAVGRSLLKKSQLKDTTDLEVIDVTKPKTTYDDIANANEEIDCIQNGDFQKKSDNEIEEPEDNPEDPSDRSRKVKLDEDPELRRMVMEVIFGSEGSSSDQSQSSNSNTPPKSTERETSAERSTSSSPNSLDTSMKNVDLLKNEDKHQRPTRNRSKVIDKDFIYDLDAVLLPERTVSKISHNSETLKVTNDKKRSPIDISNFKESDDLTAVHCDDNKINNKIQEMAKTNSVICEK